MNSFSQILKQAIQYNLLGIHTALPGQIESYDYSQQKADVKPLIKRNYKDGEVTALPVITSVPVIWPRAGNASLTFPLNKGDGVLLVFSERSMDTWLSIGSDAVPGDPRKFDLSDAIAIPGLYPFCTSGLAENNADVLLRHGEAKFKLDSSAKIAIGNDSQELLDLLDQLLTALIQTTVPTALGPQHLSKVTDGTIGQIQSDLDEIKGIL